jgi:hypothetical protein
MNVSMVGWESGLQKITLVKAIREETLLELRNAKACLDRLLDGTIVTFRLTDDPRASRFAARLRSYGVIVETHEGDIDPASFVGGSYPPGDWDLEELAKHADAVEHDSDGRVVGISIEIHPGCNKGV